MNRIVRRVLWWHLATVMVVAAAAAATGAVGPGGVLLGGGTLGLAVFAYGAALGLVMQRGSRRLAMTLLFAKFCGFLGLGWWAFSATQQGPDPLGFAVGVTCFPFATVVGALRARGIDGTL